MGARTKARKRAVDVLFEADQRGVPPVTMLSQRVAVPGTQTSLPQYAVEIVEGVDAQRERIDELLETYSHGWTLERMPAVDRAILRAGVWEIVFNADVPAAVTLDEATGLAKSLSTDESPAFVNGLLARIADLGLAEPAASAEPAGSDDA
ncbi:transcription antitermination factor NusB [Luteimicrobium subarcticum]|uniref:Transcription antitermination protein NusB n=1 Tax=Luteimicrobium subarcticum TaxID=620910 RepID=A0A2M8W3W1_9MICO|nr:transcription antitermination factor NusB [Luteimicrobium subarcticum]PJI85612.1 NusB antitermination factor [Luteimicrobium subarcticum]